MKKIYIVGIVASGKTTMAKRLSQQLNIPFYELDCIVHVKTENGRYKRTPDEQVQEINRIDKEDDWIIEGTYRESCRCLLDLADEVIFLDPPLWLRKFRIILRFFKQQLHIEPCHYKSDIKMLKLMYKWTNDFERTRKQFEQMLDLYKYKLTRISKSNEYHTVV